MRASYRTAKKVIPALLAVLNVCLLMTFSTVNRRAGADDLVLKGGYVISDIQVVRNLKGFIYFIPNNDAQKVWALDSKYIISCIEKADPALIPLQPTELKKYFPEEGVREGEIQCPETKTEVPENNGVIPECGLATVVSGKNSPSSKEKGSDIITNFILESQPSLAETNAKHSEKEVKPLATGGEEKPFAAKCSRENTTFHAKSTERLAEDCADFLPERSLSPAVTDRSPNQIEGKTSVAIDLQYATYALAEWYARFLGINNGSSGRYRFIGHIPGAEGGFGFHGGFQYGLQNYLSAGLDMEYLNAFAEGDFQWTNYINGSDHGSETFSYTLPLFAIGGLVKYVIPAGRTLIFTGGFGIYSLSLSGSHSLTAPADRPAPFPSQTLEINGSGMGYKLQAGWEAFLNQRLSLGMDTGYRWAKITRVHYRNVTFRNEGYFTSGDGSYLPADYSGLFVEGGLRLYF